VSDTRPIGVFDSGLGGLTVVREMIRLMPGEKIVYLGDTARVPYGGRSPDTIRLFAEQDAAFLMSLDIKMLIVACNTISSVGLDAVRRVALDTPVIDVVLPGAKAAVMRTAEKKIGVIGTRATIGANAYANAIQDVQPNVKVFGQACPLFVPIVEEGLADGDIARLTVQHYLYRLVNIGIDVLILGCTHYPLLMEAIQETVGTRIQLIDSALWTAKEAQDVLIALNALSPDVSGGLDKSIFHVTDLTPNFESTAAAFLGVKLPRVEKISLDALVRGVPAPA
jgi:glutamate racemase